MKRAADLRRAGLAAVAVVWLALAGGAGCGSSDTTRIDVSVTIDPALGLHDVTVDVQGGNRPQLEQNFAVGDAGTSGSPRPIVWEVVVSNPTRPFEAIVTASGHSAGGTVVVTDIHAVNVRSGQHVAVQLTLSEACAMKFCPSGQHCAAGSCMDIPVTGPSLDAGVTDGTGSGGKVGGGGHGGGKVGGGGIGGGAGSSQPVDAHPTDGGGDTTAAGGSGGGGKAGHDGGVTDASTDTGPAKSPVGQKCSSGTECGSGFCAQGVCCSTACTQTCYACTNALTGSSPDGTCAVVSSGLGDPAGTCVAGTAMSCGNTGHCDGKGACEKFGSSTICQPASCATSGFTSASTCNGKGTCTPGTTTDCKGFTCSATSGCATTCSTDNDCSGGYCTSGKICAATVADGAACSKNSQCTHANCVAGVCCATACAGTCMTCATGLCKPVAAGGSSGGACALGTTTCGHDGTCDGNGGCRFATSSVSCGTAACSGGQLTPAGTCNGAGACSIPAASGCAGGVVCASTSACKSSTCVADGDCVSGLCSGGSCASKRANGQACGASNQCTSNNCVDGVCCNSACTGTCQSCAETTSGHSPGTCANIAGTPRSGHGTCTGSGTCASTCDGSSPSCVFPGSSKSCRSASCSAGTQTLAATCDGAGNCPAAVTQGCGSYMCGTTSCLTGCSSTSQCVSGAVCQGTPGKCTACSAGQTVCPTGCADLSTDGNNCGACGHSCYGGACSGSKCQPVSVYSSTVNNATFAVGSNRVYVVLTSTSGTTIQYMPTNAVPGASLSPLSTINGQSCGFLNPDPATGDLMLQCFAITSSGLVDSGTQYMRRVSATAGGAGNQLFQVGTNQLGAIPPYPTGTGVFVFGEIDLPQEVRVAHTDGSALGDLIVYPSGTSLNAVVGADQTSAYAWMSSSTGQVLNQVSLTTGSSITLINGYSSAGMLSDNSSVFWYVGGQGIYSVPKNMTTPPQTVVMSDPNLAVFGAVDSSSVFYATQVDTVTGATGCSSYRVAHRPKTGGAETPMYDGTSTCVTAMRGDANVIVYGTRGLGCATTTCNYGIYKVAK